MEFVKKIYIYERLYEEYNMKPKNIQFTKSLKSLLKKKKPKIKSSVYTKS
jgi:hypothetical protein